MTDLWLDSETFSPIPISHGVHRYAEGVEVMLITWAIGDGPAQCWDLTAGEPCSPELDAALMSSDMPVWFQNGGKFDWVVLEADPKTRWIAQAVDPTRRRDTMVQAYSHSLPGSLDMMCAALGIAEEESKIDGKRFIRLFCMPPAANAKDRSRRTRETHPVEWEQFKTYAKQDITAMRAAHRKMPMWNYKDKQLELEALDAKINARGFKVDIALAEAVIRASDIAKSQLAGETQRLTNDEVQAATQRDQMLAHILTTYGVDLPDMQKDTIERRALDESLPEELRELLRIRLESTMTSVSKFATLLRGVSKDGRLRGTMQYRGASRTGRAGHRMFQPGNMPRPTMKANEIAWAIELLKMDAAHLVYSNVMRVCSNAIRGSIIADEGKKLVVADLANIEGRVISWLAGEEWKLQAFCNYDAGTGPDLYILAYASSFNVPSESVVKGTIEGDRKRQIGKVQELMFSFGGGVGAWITGAATYGIDLVQMTEQVYDTLPTWARDEATSFLKWLYDQAVGKRQLRIDAIIQQLESDATQDVGKLNEEHTKLSTGIEASKLKVRFGLAEKVFITCDAIKRLWRRAHPAISSYWKELENTIEACIDDPGVTRQCRKLKIRRDGEWLRIALPSGRALCYPSPRWNYTYKPKVGPEKRFPGFSYMGVDNYTKKWSRIGSYGGMVAENCTQAVAADQFFECLPLIEKAGYATILHVHDEYVTETPNVENFTADELSNLMCSSLGWNEGLPLSAAGYEDQRYRKN